MKLGQSFASDPIHVIGLVQNIANYALNHLEFIIAGFAVLSVGIFLYTERQTRRADRRVHGRFY